VDPATHYVHLDIVLVSDSDQEQCRLGGFGYPTVVYVSVADPGYAMGK
jgi:hypothetical protein